LPSDQHGDLTNFHSKKKHILMADLIYETSVVVIVVVIVVVVVVVVDLVAF